MLAWLTRTTDPIGRRLEGGTEAERRAQPFFDSLDWYREKYPEGRIGYNSYGDPFWEVEAPLEGGTLGKVVPSQGAVMFLNDWVTQKAREGDMDQIMDLLMTRRHEGEHIEDQFYREDPQPHRYQDWKRFFESYDQHPIAVDRLSPSEMQAEQTEMAFPNNINSYDFLPEAFAAIKAIERARSGEDPGTFTDEELFSPQAVRDRTDWRAPRGIPIYEDYERGAQKYKIRNVAERLGAR